MRPTELLLVVAFGYLSLLSLRNVMWWGWVTAPITAASLAACAAQWRAWREARRQAAAPTGQAQQREEQATGVARTEIPAFNWVIAGLLVGGALLFTPLWRPANPFVPATAKAALSDNTPTKLAQYLKDEDVPTPLFNYMEWGGYLGWELYPRYKMFVDGRFEAREVQVWDDYLSISRGHANWSKTLDSYGVNTLVLNKEFHEKLIPLVTEDAGWRKVYEDKAGVIFTR
jgi:hypothetical protein